MRYRLFFLSLIAGILTTNLIAPQSTLTAELEEIKQRGQLIVAVKNNLRPLGFTDAEGNLIGLEIDLARRLAAELLGDPNAVILQPVTNQERLKVVIDEEVDLVIARVSVTDSRMRIVDFSPYYYLDGTGFVTKTTSSENLTEAKIALLERSATIAVVRRNFPQAQLIGVKSYQEALELLETGQADAFAGDRSVLAGWVQEYPEYKLLPVRLRSAPLSIVMPKGLQYQELRQEVNEAIARWRESGWLQERIEYWGLP